MADVETRIKRYIDLRDYIAAAEKQHKAALAPYLEGMVKLEGSLRETLKESGVDSMKSASGTAYITTKRYVSIEDKEVFFNWLRESDAWDMLTLQANKSAVSQYRDEHNDIPPGIDYKEELAVNVRRA